MFLGRFLRTVRYLTIEQLTFRIKYLIKRHLIRLAPEISRKRIQRIAEGLPVPCLTDERLIKIAQLILTLQLEVYGDSYEEVTRGKFKILNSVFDFKHPRNVCWRSDFNEGNNPLRRMNLAYMGYAVPLLARGKIVDLRLVVDLINSLERQNGWSRPGVFGDVWNTYAVSHRLINLLTGLALYKRAGGQAGTDAETCVLNHIRFCAAFITKNLERDLQYNHLLKNYVALTVFSAACSSTPRGFLFLKKSIPKSLKQNILSDGGHAERSPMYHLLALVDVKILKKSVLFSDHWYPLLEVVLRKMEKAIGAMTLADGDIALMNDSWLGEVPCEKSLASISEVPSVQALPVTGYYALKSKEESVVFDCGPCGPKENAGHAHADFLSFESTFGSTRFIVDTGVPTYTAGSDRNLTRSAASHNGPRLENVEPIEFWKSFRVGRRGSARPLDMVDFPEFSPMQVAGLHNGYKHLGISIGRYVGLWPKAALIVSDLWIGTNPAATADFLISGDWKIDKEQNFVLDDMTVSVKAAVGTISRPVPDFHWLRFGIKKSAYRINVIPEFFCNGARATVIFSFKGSFDMENLSLFRKIETRLEKSILSQLKQF